jgi:putative folate metabolism gamma-glutamate ligase
MQVHTIKTHRIEYGESIENILDYYFKEVLEEDIIFITSKIISIIEGSFVDKDSIEKYDLIKREADYLIETDNNPYNIYLTVKNGILIPSAGIDESNVDDVYVLYPRDIQRSTNFIWQYLRNKHDIKSLGLVITDSHTTIMRRGVVGIALGWCGFKPLYSYVNKPDIYGRPLKVTQVNIIDSLAVSAVFVMGEGNEQTPMAIIREAPQIYFSDKEPTIEEISSVKIAPEEDLYYPILKSLKLTKNSVN